MAVAAIWRHAAITAGLVLMCWGVWDGGGALLHWLGLGERVVVGQVCLEFAFLTLAEAVFARLGRADQAEPAAGERPKA